ncbi:hypothetical protein, partial [Flavobacterium gelidilacus]
FEKNAITSELNFNNYLLNKLEDNSYYFKDFDRFKQYELDLFLLNQKTSKYDWNNILTKTPSIKYPFDVGLTIEGTLSQTLSNKDKYSINLSSIANGIKLSEKIDNKNNFVFENIIAIDSASFYISLLNNKSEYESIKLHSKISNNRNKFLKPLPILKTRCENKVFSSSEEFNLDFPYSVNTNILREVVLTEKVVEKLEYTKHYYNRTGAKGYKIDENKAATYIDILGFLQAHGYSVSNIGGNVSISNITAGNSFGKGTSISFFIDDVPIGSLDFLSNMSLYDIDEIYLNKRGFGTGMTAPNGTIRMYTKIKVGRIKTEVINSKSITIKDGFQKEKPFKNPIYSYYENQAFKKYGTINWIPSIYTDDNGDFEFKIPTLGQKSILLNIQGIDNEGNFYYENIEIEVN